MHPLRVWENNIIIFIIIIIILIIITIIIFIIIFTIIIFIIKLQGYFFLAPKQHRSRAVCRKMVSILFGVIPLLFLIYSCYLIGYFAFHVFHAFRLKEKSDHTKKTISASDLKQVWTQIDMSQQCILCQVQLLVCVCVGVCVWVGVCVCWGKGVHSNTLPCYCNQSVIY